MNEKHQTRFFTQNVKLQTHKHCTLFDHNAKWKLKVHAVA